MIRLLEDPTLIQQELDRRLVAARASDPTKKHEQSLQRELTRVGNSIERILNAYQEQLLSLEQLRERMPPLRQREHVVRAELQAIADQAGDRAMFLRLAETLTAFLARLRDAADTLDVLERQRIVRLVGKEVLIGDDAIVIRHCIPIAAAPPPDDVPPPPRRSEGAPIVGNCLLRKGSDHATLRSTRTARLESAVLPLHRSFQPPLDVEQHPSAVGMPTQRTEKQLPIETVEERLNVEVEHPVFSPAPLTRCAHGIERRSARSISVGVGMEHRFQSRLQGSSDNLLGDAVRNRRMPNGRVPPDAFGMSTRRTGGGK